MASDDHLKLSNIIKQIHEDLRIKTTLLGVDNAWKFHCSNENTLKLYATAMKDLATNHWETTDDTKWNRIYWTAASCLNYFTKDIKDFRLKETQIATKMNITLENAIPIQLSEELQVWNLLDVGSCYNPFKIFNYFKVLPIDIAPASEEVYKCDFLGVPTDLKLTYAENRITKLPECYFDVIIFSLLLEYLPSPIQRKSCCQKAYNLLKTEGLLAIITPDSNHVGSNAQLMKSWRFILADIGFTRIKYEKLPHVHCMLFRKTCDKLLSQRWANIHRKDQVYDEMFIPQDFKKRTSSNTNSDISNSSEKNEDSNFLNELPFGAAND